MIKVIKSLLNGSQNNPLCATVEIMQQHFTKYTHP